MVNQDALKQSKLMQNWPSKTIPNAIDTEFWKPLNKQSGKKYFQSSSKMVSF